ncbi:MAG: hypothetical protein RIQ38_2704 [Pseudomonadota bacterium]|jgi:hypothetical protein
MIFGNDAACRALRRPYPTRGSECTAIAHDQRPPRDPAPQEAA